MRLSPLWWGGPGSRGGFRSTDRTGFVPSPGWWLDGAVAVWIAFSPFVADTSHFKFFGGYPMSWVFHGGLHRRR